MNSIMKMPKYLRWVKPLGMLISGLVTLWVLVVFWSWLGPATFWQKVAGVLLSIGGGIMLFAAIQILISMLFGLVLSRYVKKQLEGQFQMAETEEDEEEDTSMYQ